MSSLSSYSAAFQNNNNNSNNNDSHKYSTKQNSELKTYNSNNGYNTETVKSRQTFTPKKSPSNKNKSVTNDLALTVVDNSTRLRGILIDFILILYKCLIYFRFNFVRIILYYLRTVFQIFLLLFCCIFITIIHNLICFIFLSICFQLIV